MAVFHESSVHMGCIRFLIEGWTAHTSQQEIRVVVSLPWSFRQIQQTGDPNHIIQRILDVRMGMFKPDIQDCVWLLPVAACYRHGLNLGQECLCKMVPRDVNNEGSALGILRLALIPLRRVFLVEQEWCMWHYLPIS